MDKPAGVNERKLVERAIQGDRTAFEGLVELYQDRVYNLSFRLTGQEHRAWDLAQEGFMRAYAAITKFKGESGFYTWIYRIVLNLHMNWETKLSGKMEKQSLSLDYTKKGEEGAGLHESIPNGMGKEPSDEMMRKERERAVQEAIATLPADQRQAVLLRDMEGMSYEQIADLLAVPVGTVRSRLHRAREGLKQRLQGVI